MHEYVTVSASSYDPAALATKLTEKSADGWDVVSIVQTGGDVTAFLRRESSADVTEDDAAEADAATVGDTPEAAEPEPIVAAVPVAEPEPEPAAAEPVAEPAGWAAEPEPAPEPVAEEAPTEVAPVVDPTPAAEPVAEPEAAAAAAAPAVPAGWYADPSGRFELRYWDGGQWTEHVARGGQQFTDPPVA